MLRNTTILIALSIAFLRLDAQVVSSSQIASTIITGSLPANYSSWANATNAGTANNAYTTAYVMNRKHTNLLIATNWGLSVGNGPNQIPSAAVINGFEVEIKMKGSNSSIRDYKIQLRKNSSINSNNLARTNSAWPQTLSYVKFGSSVNLWGLSWTPAEIAASTFGVEIAAQGRTSPGTAMIDHIKITVYYNLRYYYSKSAGNLTTLGTWGVNTDGSGIAPPNFSDSGQIFFLRNRAAVTLNANLAITGAASKMVIGDGTNPTAFTIPSTAVLDALVDVTPNGTLNIANITSPIIGSLDNNSTVAYNATANQTVQELTYYHLIMGGTGTKTSDVTGNAITVNGNLTINSGVTFNNTDEDLVANGNVINSGTTTGSAFIWMNGIVASTISGTNGVFSNLKTDNDLSVSLSSSQTISDTLTLTSQPFTTGAFLNLNAGATVIRDDGTLSASPTSSNLYDVQYIGVTKTTGTEITSFIRNFTLSLVDTLPNTLTLSQALSLKGYLQLDSGTLDVSTGNYNITVFKNVIAKSVLNNRSNTFTLNGNALQIISGTNSITFYKLTVNNAAGLQLQEPVLVNNLLTFTNGLITTDNTNKLTLGSSATTTGEGSTKYINGPLSKIVATLLNTTTSYPIGRGGLYRPVTLEVTHVAITPTTYTLEMINGAPPAATLPAGITSVSNYRYFQVSKVGAGVAVAFITLNYGTEDNIAIPANTRVAQRIAGNWLNLGGAGNAAPSGNIRSSINFTTFNDFAIADVTSALPVTLISFKGVVNNGTAKLQWLTGNENNIDHYEIEKSVNGINWNTAGALQALTIPQTQNSYLYNDKDPYSGKSYYRLKIIDKNLGAKYSEIISVFNSNPEKPKISLRPSLTDIKQSSIVIKGIVFSTNEKILLKVFNSGGNLVIKKVCTAQEQLPLDFHNLPDGMYVVATEIKGVKYSLPFIIW